jgi:hypothetical protein
LPGDESSLVDDRTVEELLSFINGETSTKSQKKKRQRRKEQPQTQSQQPQPKQTQPHQQTQPQQTEPEEQGKVQSPRDSTEILFSEGHTLSSPPLILLELFEEEERTIDPNFKAQVDREVEEWRLKLEQISVQYQGPKVKLPDFYVASIGVK